MTNITPLKRNESWEYVSSYECDQDTVNLEFEITKNQYAVDTGRGKPNGISYSHYPYPTAIPIIFSAPNAYLAIDNMGKLLWQMTNLMIRK